jgi:hypothetical protein
MPVGGPAYGAYQISMFFCFTDSHVEGDAIQFARIG